MPANRTLPPAALPGAACAEAGFGGGASPGALAWGLAEDDAVFVLQTSPAFVVLILAVLDLRFRVPAQSPVREHREVGWNICAILPSLVWRSVNWLTCALWVVMELYGGAIDIPETVFALSCAGECPQPGAGAGDCAAGRPPRVSELGAYARASVATEYASLEDLRGLMAPVKAVAPIFLVLNGVLTLWAWQYYHGVHTLYRSLFERGPDWFKTVAPPDAFLSELSGIELILGAADTCLVNLPVCWMANRLYDSGLGLGLYGHINLSMSIVTYIANMWLFADKSPIMDTCKLHIMIRS